VWHNALILIIRAPDRPSRERNLDIQHAKECLRTPQPARESARIFCPGRADGRVLTGALGTQTQRECRSGPDLWTVPRAQHNVLDRPRK
jgi:hypothetical protein